MENASKALLIAGAILLAILIISLGIMVYNNAKNTVGNASLNKQEIEAFNSQWQAYVGENKTASEVYSMMSAVIASNAAEANSGANRWVNFKNSNTAGTTPATTQPTGLSPAMPASNTTYTIVAGYASNGLIVELAYAAKNSTPAGNTTNTTNP